MLSNEERDEIRREVYRDVVEIEDEVYRNRAGSYRYLCLIAGEPVFTHAPVGRVLRYIL